MRNPLDFRASLPSRQAQFSGQAPWCAPIWTLYCLLLCACSCGFGATFSNLTVATFSATDLAIFGPGFFLVRDPDEDLLYARRMGDFHVDADGYLVANDGLRVQGFKDVVLSQIGDVKIDTLGIPGKSESYIQTFRIESDGRIVLTLTDGSENVRGQILLQNFKNPSALSNLGHWVYSFEALAGPLPKLAVPGTEGVGTLAAYQLEALRPRVSLNQVHGGLLRCLQGALTATGNQTDLAIQGKGFFVLRDTNSDAFYATRAGAFYTDPNGFLVNYEGKRIQGFIDTNLSLVGDVRLPAAGSLSSADPSRIVSQSYVNRFGKIVTVFTDNLTQITGQILLRSFQAVDQLVWTNFNVCALAGQGWSPMTAPGHNGMGWLFCGTLEASQLDEAILSVRRTLNFFQQGPILASGVVTDLALSGPGFFTLRDPVSNTLYATRNGSFHLDSSNHLVNTNGLHVQGFNDAGLSIRGDIAIDAAGIPINPTNAGVTGFSIDRNGRIAVILAGGVTFNRAQILVQNFANLQALHPSGDGLYSNLEAAHPLSASGIPQTFDLGRIVSGALEIVSDPPALVLPPREGFRLLAWDLQDDSTVETSNDFVHWVALGRIPASFVGFSEFFDTAATANASRFYRLRQP